jgi:hypothetical protein
MDHVARTDLVQQILRIGGMRRVFHRVKVIEVAEELVEAVHRRQEFVQIAKMVLAELTGGVAYSLQRLGDRDCLRRQADGRAGLADRGHAGADRQLAGDEVRAARGAARFRVVVGEQHAFGGQLVEVRRPPGHHAAMVGAEIPDADIVAHDDDDIWPLSGRRGRRRRWLLLRLRGGCQSNCRKCRSGDERTTVQQQIAAFQAYPGRFGAGLRLFRNPIVTHGVILFLAMHLKLTWLDDEAYRDGAAHFRVDPDQTMSVPGQNRKKTQ